jgi:hypothetical protein
MAKDNGIDGDEFFSGLSAALENGPEAVQAHFDKYIPKEDQSDLQEFSELFRPHAVRAALNMVIGRLVMSGDKMTGEDLFTLAMSSAIAGAYIYRGLLDHIDPEARITTDAYIKSTQKED